MTEWGRWSAVLLLAAAPLSAQKYTDSGGNLRVALVKQPFVPNGTSTGRPRWRTAASRSSSPDWARSVRIEEARLTPDEDTEYGGWKRLGLALGHFAASWRSNERDGYFTVGLLGTCPSMPGMVAGLAALGPDDAQPLQDRHALARRASGFQHAGDDAQRIARRHARRGRDRPRLQRMRLDAGLDPPLADEHVVMGGVRLTDPLEQESARQVADRAADGRRPAHDLAGGLAQLDRLSRLADKIYVHIDMDVLDPREVMAHRTRCRTARRASSSRRSSR